MDGCSAVGLAKELHDFHDEAAVRDYRCAAAPCKGAGGAAGPAFAASAGRVS